MLTIANLAAKNVKGRTFNYALGPVTVFTGPNASGKTAIADAIRAGLTGQHPKLGKRDVTKLAGGSAMSIRVGLSNGTASTHDWTCKAGAWKYKGELAPEAVPGVLLDAAAYFNLTGDERVKFIFRLLPDEVTGLTANRVIAELNRLPATTERVVALRTELSTDIARLFGKHLPPDALAESIARCKKAKADSDAVAKQMTASILAQTQMQAQEGMTVARNVDGELARVRGVIAEQNGRLAALRKDADTHAKAVARLTQLKDEIDTAEAAAAVVDAMEQNVAELRSKLDTFPDGALDKAQAEHDMAVRELEQTRIIAGDKQAALVEAKAQAETEAKRAARRAEIATEQEAATEAMHAAEEQLQVAAALAELKQTELSDSASALNKAGNDTHRLTEEVREAEDCLAELASHKACPFCECDQPGWNTRLSMRLIEKRDSLRAKLDEAKQTRKLASENRIVVAEQAGNASLAAEQARAASQAARGVFLTLTGELAGMPKPRTALSPGQITDCEDGLAVLAATLPKLEQACHSAKDALAKAKVNNDLRLSIRNALGTQEAKLNAAKGSREKLASLCAEHNSLSALPVADPAAISSLTTELAAAQAKERELTEATKRAAAAAQDAKRREQAKQEAEDVKAVATFSKDAAERLVEMQTEAIDASFNAVLGTAWRITEGILGTPLVYRDGDIGRVEDGVFISHLTFSGMEERLAYAALQVALAGPDSAMRLVMVDELSTLDPDNKAKLIERMLTLTREGVIGQFIGFDCDARFYTDEAHRWVKDGLQVVAVGG